KAAGAKSARKGIPGKNALCHAIKKQFRANVLLATFYSEVTIAPSGFNREARGATGKIGRHNRSRHQISNEYGWPSQCVKYRFREDESRADKTKFKDDEKKQDTKAKV